ncbi:hypothetical protein GCM10010486_76300 [Nonomuraea roseoviolacea subsp. carminata]
MPFLPEQDDLAFEPPGPQGLDTAHSGQAGSGHHDTVHVHDHNGAAAGVRHRGRRLGAYDARESGRDRAERKA